MKITLTDGDTVFEIANGLDRNARVSEDWRPSMTQQTPESVRCRAGHPTAFPERAVRVMQVKIPVMFPACETSEEAIMQSMMIPAQCPKGGVLKVYHLGNEVTYPQAWIEGEIGCENINIRNLFTFPVKGVNPTAVSYVLDGDGEILEDGEGAPLTWT